MNVYPYVFGDEEEVLQAARLAWQEMIRQGEAAHMEEGSFISGFLVGAAAMARTLTDKALSMRK